MFAWHETNQQADRAVSIAGIESAHHVCGSQLIVDQLVAYVACRRLCFADNVIPRNIDSIGTCSIFSTTAARHYHVGSGRNSHTVSKEFKGYQNISNVSKDSNGSQRISKDLKGSQGVSKDHKSYHKTDPSGSRGFERISTGF